MAAPRDARPERTAPAERFYNAGEASRYAQNARMAQIQTHLAQRAVHLLGLPEKSGGALILDLGCGTGYSGRAIERGGNFWVGLDVSADMLGASRRAGKLCDQLCHDMGDGLPFRRRMFDGAISISAVQWLCVSTQSHHRPAERLDAFFRGLRRCLRPGARAVLQLYPEDPSQLEQVRAAAIAADFGGALVADFPTSEAAKKFFLVLCAPQVAVEPRRAAPAEQADARRRGRGGGGGRGAGRGRGRGEPLRAGRVRKEAGRKDVWGGSKRGGRPLGGGRGRRA
ncbi:hypothetical protein KFE25_006698 [Diacronema lutheri]|uniref:Methyltransferase type 11 domain-containing protein n=1 Tax=Diacronema lutheri TaxID=2081491 RepID=A0A8J6CE02_DIALT|nr:hypothetical protein KFE25_006698 [Diacronema lutheri]